jgi:hypothetical protein
MGAQGDPGPDSIFLQVTRPRAQGAGNHPAAGADRLALHARLGQVVENQPASGGKVFPGRCRTIEARVEGDRPRHSISVIPTSRSSTVRRKGAMYMSASATENPEFVGGPIEPFNHDAAWGVKWVIEDQIKGAPDLNYDPARGPVKAPWLSWGPYFWSHPDGTPRNHDGFVWTMADVARTSCTHRSAASPSTPTCFFTRWRPIPQPRRGS